MVSSKLLTPNTNYVKGFCKSRFENVNFTQKIRRCATRHLKKNNGFRECPFENSLVSQGSLEYCFVEAWNSMVLSKVQKPNSNYAEGFCKSRFEKIVFCTEIGRCVAQNHNNPKFQLNADCGKC